MAWDAEMRERAVAAAREHGIAEAHRLTGVPKPSISRWCVEAGVDVMEVHRVKHGQLVARAEALVRRADGFEAYLEAIQVEAGRFVHTVAAVNGKYALEVAGMDPDLIREKTNHETGDRWVEFDDPDVEALRLRVRALKEASLEVPHAIGAFTRATHDLRLLRELSTENVATSVSFVADLAPAALEAVEIVDADEVD